MIEGQPEFSDGSSGIPANQRKIKGFGKPKNLRILIRNLPAPQSKKKKKKKSYHTMMVFQVDFFINTPSHGRWRNPVSQGPDWMEERTEN